MPAEPTATGSRSAGDRPDPPGRASLPAAAAWVLVPLLSVSGAALLPGDRRLAGALLLGAGLLLQVLLTIRSSGGRERPGDLSPRAALSGIPAKRKG